jgi:hypothetical protein
MVLYIDYFELKVYLMVQIGIEIEAPMSLVLLPGQEWWSYTSIPPYVFM